VRPEQVALGEETAAGAPSFGKATVAEQTFAGGLRRVRVRLPETGFRQIFPVTPYGEEGILIDAVVAADRELDPEVEVSLKRWRVLAQPKPRVLVADAGLRSAEALAAAIRVGRDIGGALTVLGVARDSDEIESLRASLVERTAAADPDQIEIRVRAGDRGGQIATELAESFYDLYVADGGGDGEKRRGPLLDEPVSSAARTRTPVLFVRGAARPLRNLLVCTAVGEPGRQAVRLGGWLAARLRARALLLHVHRGEEEPPEWIRAHLERGVRTLHALGVQGEFRVRRARTPLEGILAEAREGEHDLVVIGSHGPRLRSVLGRDDVTNQVLTASDRPVLVIPADQ
jgi:nucleotide-binding universal stress UspA family protein